jgi:hypothetical protein
MESSFTVGSTMTALRAAAVAACLAGVTGTSLAADGATLRITSFTVSAAEFSGNFVWTIDAYQSFDMNALQAGGAGGASTDTYSADNWDLGLNRFAQTPNAMATGNLVRFTDAMTQLATAGFNLDAVATPGPFVPAALPHYANASALQSGAFVLIDENGQPASGTVTFDVYYNLGVAAPEGAPSGYSQTVLNLLSSSDGGGSTSFADGLLSSAFAGGSGSTSGHFTWTYVLEAGQAAYYTLSGSAISSAVAAVPEPSTYLLMAMGLAGIGGLTRRRLRTA